MTSFAVVSCICRTLVTTFDSMAALSFFGRPFWAAFLGHFFGRFHGLFYCRDSTSGDLYFPTDFSITAAFFKEGLDVLHVGFSGSKASSHNV